MNLKTTADSPHEFQIEPILQEVEDLVEGKKHIRSLKEWLD